MDLTDKNVVITGSTDGIGLATAGLVAGIAGAFALRGLVGSVGVNLAADSLIEAGRMRIFTPDYFFLARRPAAS